MTRFRWAWVLPLLLVSVAGAHASAPKPPSDKVAAREKMLQDKVGLDAVKAKKVAAALEAHKTARKPLRAEIKAAFEALDKLAKDPKADDAALTAASARVSTAREKLHALELQQKGELEKLLTPRENARWVLTTRKGKKHSPAKKPDAKAPAKDDDDDE